MQTPDAGARRVVVAVRAAVLALCATLCLALGALPGLGWRLVLLVLLALAMSLAPAGRGLAVWLPVVEGALAAAITSMGLDDPTPLLPYLVVAPVAAGVLSGFVATFVTVIATFAALVVVRQPDTVAEKAELAEWVVLGLAIGLLGAWARWAAREAASRAGSYAAANRLLSELRDVARALPTGLDEVSLAQAAMDDVGDRLGFDRGALYARSESGYLMPLAIVGAERVDWDPDAGELWDRAWATGRPVQAAGQFSDPTSGQRVVAPLRLGDRAVGLVALERDDGNWGRDELAGLALVAQEAAMRIDTGHMFSDLRALATVEERRRVAREIHDGDRPGGRLGLGYLVDDLAARSTDVAVRGRPARPPRRAHQDRVRAAAVHLRPAQRRRARHGSRRGPGLVRASGRHRRRDSPCTSSSTSRPAGCRWRPRPSCCASPRRRSPTLASIPGPATSG